MAGIAGAVAPLPWDPQPLLAAMGRSLRYSATGGVAVWHDDHAALCHVRSGVDHSAPQPLLSSDRAKRIVFFGECFGYTEVKRDLARRGHAFVHPNSDAEFVLHLYEEFGDKSLPLLSGSFSFAVHDSATGELILANDRLGSRPLFYGMANDGKLVFATQVASVLCSPDISRDLDVAAAVEFCNLQKVLGDKTYHQGVKMLPPASLLRFSNGQVAITQYWRPEYRPQPGSRAAYAEELAATMKQAMRDVTRGEGPVGMLLSGGLDARMMVAAADSDLACYTFADYQNPEFRVAEKIAAAKGYDLCYLRRDENHYPSILENAVKLGSGMHPFNHAHALGFVDQIAEECGAVTHGYGIEALFRGTTLIRCPIKFAGRVVSRLLDPTLTLDQLQFRYYRRAYSLLDKYPQILVPSVRSDLEELIRGEANRVINEALPHCSHLQDTLLWSDIFYRSRYTGYLFLLSLRPFATERSVLFNNDVIDLHLKTPIEYRSDDRLWLRAMELLDKRVAHVIDANTGHSPFANPTWIAALDVGRNLVQRVPLIGRILARNAAEPPADGLSPISWPRFDWMIRHNGALRAQITDTLNDPEALPEQIFEREQVRQILAAHLRNTGHHRQILFALLTLGRWLTRYGRATSS